jgi:hypothetical protein
VGGLCGVFFFFFFFILFSFWLSWEQVESLMIIYQTSVPNLSKTTARSGAEYCQQQQIPKVNGASSSCFYFEIRSLLFFPPLHFLSLPSVQPSTQ